MSMYDEFEDRSESLALLEEEMLKYLLIEAVNAKKAEIYENVVFEGKRRYYVEDLSIRDYQLENTTPYQLSIKDKIMIATSWGQMLCDMVNYLLEIYPLENETLLDFRSTWTKSAMFAALPKTNHKILSNGLYLNCNHTALHSCWLLQDLLALFAVNISDVTLLIHRPCSAEPLNVKKYIEDRFKKGMVEYLQVDQGLSEQDANAIVTVIARYLNPALGTISRSYTNFFLFDDAATLYNYVKKVRDKINQSPTFKLEAKKLFNLALDYLVKYFKCSTY